MADGPKVIRGVDVLIYVGDVLVGGQQGCTLNRNGDALETSHKGTGAWRTFIVGLLEWGIDFDGLVIEDDAGYDALETAFNNRETVNVEMRMPSGKVLGGAVAITDFPVDAGFEELVTYTVTTQGATGMLDQSGQVLDDKTVDVLFKTESKVKK